jgi:hypothetical protein
MISETNNSSRLVVALKCVVAKMNCLSNPFEIMNTKLFQGIQLKMMISKAFEDLV